MSEDIYSRFNIDKSKLKRDYIKNPLHKFINKGRNGSINDIPYKEDFVYITSILKLNEILMFFNITKSQYHKFRRKLGLSKPLNRPKYIKIMPPREDISYAQFNINPNMLKRDYIKNPLSRGNGNILNELPYKEDLEYLYNVVNLTYDDLCLFFNFRKTKMRRILQGYGIYRQDPKVSLKFKKETTKLIYGDENYNNLIKNKKTKKERYGSENYYNIEKQKETCLQRYGSEYFFTSDKFYDFISNPENLNSKLDKMKETNLLRYGVDNPAKNPEIRDKIISSLLKNRTISQSQTEDRLYEMLKSKFPDSIHQYKSKLYPFACDFYIPSKDLYIEYQGFLSHGNEPYDGNNEEHQKILTKWKNKNTDFYDSLIKVWTIRDPYKRSVAKQNNLNWLEFFTEKQFIEWFNSI